MATTEPAQRPVVLAAVMNLRGNCNWLPGSGHSDFAINADTQTFATLEVKEEPFPRKDPHRSYPSTSRIVYLDLTSGHEISSSPASWWWVMDVHLAISRDGRQVIALHKGDDTMYNCDYPLWAWRPYSNSQTTRDYDFASEGDPEAQLVFFSIGNSPPVISPDGTRVAGFGHRFRPDEGCKDEVWEDALGVLDLDSGKVTVIPLPITTRPSHWQYWHLGWSSDGRLIHAVLHGSYSGHFPDRDLYRFSVALKTVTRIGMVPPTTIGFGPDDTLVVADPAKGVFGPYRAFALMPISQIERLHLEGYEAGIAFAAGLTMTEVVTEDDLEFESFRQVWVGRKRTYAEVLKRGTKGCTVLVEVTPSIQKGR